MPDTTSRASPYEFDLTAEPVNEVRCGRTAYDSPARVVGAELPREDQDGGKYPFRLVLQYAKYGY